jgi:hypothetical protein
VTDTASAGSKGGWQADADADGKSIDSIRLGDGCGRCRGARGRGRSHRRSRGANDFVNGLAAGQFHFVGSVVKCAEHEGAPGQGRPGSVLRKRGIGVKADRR